MVLSTKTISGYIETIFLLFLSLCSGKGFISEYMNELFNKGGYRQYILFFIFIYFTNNYVRGTVTHPFETILTALLIFMIAVSVSRLKMIYLYIFIMLSSIIFTLAEYKMYLQHKLRGTDQTNNFFKKWVEDITDKNTINERIKKIDKWIYLTSFIMVALLIEGNLYYKNKTIWDILCKKVNKIL